MPKFQTGGMEFLETAPHHFSTEVEIAGNIDLVWSILTDNSTWVEWFENCAYVFADDNEWTEVGQPRTLKTTPFVLVETLLAVDPSNRSMVYELNHSNLPMANCLTESLELTDTSRNGEDFTKIHWNAGFKPLWYLAPFAFVNRYLMTRTWTRSLGRIQGVVDSRRR